MCDVTDTFMRLKVPPKYNLTKWTNISVLQPMTTLKQRPNRATIPNITNQKQDL